MVSQSLHVLERAPGMRRDEIRDEAHMGPRLPVHPVELLPEPLEEAEGRLAHLLEYVVLGMFRRHLQAA